MPHGQAIAIGMMCACDIAMGLGMFKKDQVEKIETLIKSAGLPVCASGIDPFKVYTATRYDKKITLGKKRFVLPTKIGHVAVCSGIDATVIKKAITVRLSD